MFLSSHVWVRWVFPGSRILENNERKSLFLLLLGSVSVALPPQAHWPFGSLSFLFSLRSSFPHLVQSPESEDRAGSGWSRVALSASRGAQVCVLPHVLRHPRNIAVTRAWCGAGPQRHSDSAGMSRNSPKSPLPRETEPGWRYSGISERGTKAWRSLLAPEHLLLGPTKPCGLELYGEKGECQLSREEAGMCVCTRREDSPSCPQDCGQEWGPGAVASTLRSSESRHLDPFWKRSPCCVSAE